MRYICVDKFTALSEINLANFICLSIDGDWNSLALFCSQRILEAALIKFESGLTGKSEPKRPSPTAGYTRSPQILSFGSTLILSYPGSNNSFVTGGECFLTCCRVGSWMFVRHFYSPLSYLLLYANVWRGVYALRVETHISKLPNNVFVEEKFHNSLQTQNCIPKKKYKQDVID